MVKAVNPKRLLSKEKQAIMFISGNKRRMSNVLTLLPTFTAKFTRPGLYSLLNFFRLELILFDTEDVRCYIKFYTFSIKYFYALINHQLSQKSMTELELQK